MSDQPHQSLWRRKYSQEEWDALPLHIRSMLHDQMKRLYAIKEETPDMNRGSWI